MSIKRAIIPIILSLGAAGSILASSAATAVVAQAPAAHALASGAHVTPEMHYVG